MEQSLGRTSEPTTEAGEADTDERDADLGQLVEYEDVAFTDLGDARRLTVDPLDAHQPSRESDDPLDPDGHVT